MAIKDYLCVGQIVKPQGLSGEVKLAPATDDITRFARLKKVFIDLGGGLSRYDVVNGRHREGSAFLALSGVGSVEAAERLRGALVYVSREDAVKLPADRYFISELLGCKVVTDAGETVGRLTDITQSGGNDVYYVKNGDKLVMFPAAPGVLLNVDIEGEIITVSARRLSEVAVYED